MRWKLYLSVAITLLLITTLLLLQQTTKEEQTITTITIEGSSTIYPVLKNIEKEFTTMHPQVRLNIKESGSRTGIQEFIKGTINIAATSRPITKEEITEAINKGKTPYLNPIANDAVIIIVHPTNKLTSLTLEELKKIFVTRELQQWEQLPESGLKGNITITGSDPKKSGTPEFLLNKLEAETFNETYNYLETTEEAINVVRDNQNTISPIALGLLEHGVKTVKINNTEPSTKTAKKGIYPLSRQLYLITNDEPKGEEGLFITHLISEEGGPSIKEAGFIPILE